MALIRGNTFQPIPWRSRVSDFVAPNLLLTVLAVVAAVDVPRQPIVQAQPRAIRQVVSHHQPPNLLLTTLAVASEPPADVTLRTPTLQDLQRRQRAPSDQIYIRREAPAAAPVEYPFFHKISDIDLSIRKPRGVVVSYSLNLSVGQFRLLPGESYTAGAPRGLRRHIVEPIPNLLTSTLFVTPQDPFRPLRWEQQSATRRRQPLPVDSYGINNQIRGGGEMPFAPPRREHEAATRRQQPLPVDSLAINLPLRTLAEDPFKPPRWEQATATRVRRPLPVESEGINNQIRGGGEMPFAPPRREHESATRRKQPLSVESLAINLPIRTIPDDPFKPLRTEQQTATRARRDQNANTWLHRHNFALVEADKHFKYDWTITRGRRQHPQEPDFRNFILSQPLAAPFEPRRTAQEPPPRRRPVPDRPTLDQNFQLPLWAHVKPIGVQYFESSPRPRQSVARYTWLHPLNLNLLGQDSFFYGPGRGPFNYDWSIKLRYRYPERASLNDFQRGVPIGVIDFNPSVPGLEYSTFLEILGYRSKPDRLHFESLKDRLHFRIEDED